MKKRKFDFVQVVMVAIPVTFGEVDGKAAFTVSTPLGAEDVWILPILAWTLPLILWVIQALIK